MAQTVADQMVEVLAAAGVKRVYGVVGDSLDGFTDATAPRRGGMQWMHVRHEGVDSLRRRRRRPYHRKPRRLRRQLRSRQSAPHQRSLRLPAHAGAGGGDCGADPLRGNRFALLPGDPSRAAVPGVLELLRARVERPEQMPRVLEIAVRRSILERCVSVVVVPGDVALKPAAAVTSAEAGRTGAG